MTKLNDMKDAPFDGTHILAVEEYDGRFRRWQVIYYDEDNDVDFSFWTNGYLEYTTDCFIGWLPLPKLPIE